MIVHDKKRKQYLATPQSDVLLHLALSARDSLVP
jgi:hypothetical protein